MPISMHFILRIISYLEASVSLWSMDFSTYANEYFIRLNLLNKFSKSDWVTVMLSVIVDIEFDLFVYSFI